MEETPEASSRSDAERETGGSGGGGFQKTSIVTLAPVINFCHRALRRKTMTEGTEGTEGERGKKKKVKKLQSVLDLAVSVTGLFS